MAVECNPNRCQVSRASQTGWSTRLVRNFTSLHALCTSLERDTSRWKLLEACLSALNNEEIVEMVERSQDVSGSSPIDGQLLLTSILPPILSEPGQ